MSQDPALQILNSISQDIRDIRESQLQTASFIGESRQDRAALHKQLDELTRTHGERITHLERTLEKLVTQKKKAGRLAINMSGLFSFLA